MEFPDLGEQCSLPSCRQLDFLPFKCNACGKIFCQHHRKYADHSCPKGVLEDKIVPTCPLCNKPVPLQPGVSPNDVVAKHIDKNCDSDEASLKRQKRREKNCAVKGCKSNRDNFRVACHRCNLNFCLNHRIEMDHGCTAPEPVASVPLPSAKPRRQVEQEKAKDLYMNSPQRRPQMPTALHVHSLQQPGLSEDEALKRAIELSLQSTGAESSRKEEEEEDRRLQDESDEAIARALQEAEFSQQVRTPVTTARDSNKQSCLVS